MADSVPQCPYVGLRPFGEDDADFFFGRARDVRIICANLESEPITVLYGASGVGKSSALQAGVLPRLRKLHKGITVNYFRNWQDKKELQLLVERLATLADPIEAELGFILLDQFEEFLLYHEQNSIGNEVDSSLSRLVNREDLPSKLLIGIREDSLSALDQRLGIRIPGLLLNTLQIEHLDVNAAREAIVKPLEAFVERTGQQYLIEPDLVDEILRGAQSSASVGLSAGVGQAKGTKGARQIETVYLQLVLKRIWTEKETQESKQLRLQTFRRIGGSNKIVESHVTRVMRSLASGSQRTIASRLFPYLITPSGRKVAQETQDLIEWGRAPKERVTAVLKSLSSSSETRLLRRLAAPEMYELFHDVLAIPMLAWHRRYLSRAKIRNWIVSIAAVALMAVAAALGYAALQKEKAATLRVEAILQAENAKTLEQSKLADRERQAAKALAEGNHRAAESFQEEAAAATEKIRQTQAALDQLKTSDQTPTLTQKLGDLTKERDTLSTEVRELRAENDQLKASDQTPALTQKLSDSIKERDSLSTQVQELRAENDQLKSASQTTQPPTGAIDAIDRNVEGVRQAVDRFNQAVNAMNLDQLHAAWLGMSPEQAKRYKQLFANSSKIDSRLSCTPNSVKFTGDTAELECQQTMVMTLAGHKNSSSDRLRISLRRTENGWVVDHVD
jgi:hypothetical protein